MMFGGKEGAFQEDVDSRGLLGGPEHPRKGHHGWRGPAPSRYSRGSVQSSVGGRSDSPRNHLALGWRLRDETKNHPPSSNNPPSQCKLHLRLTLLLQVTILR